MDKIKYIKYKEKYLQLKKSLNTSNNVDNVDNVDNNISMVGGFPFGAESKTQHGIKGSTGTLYAMAVVTGETLARFNERRVGLGWV